MGGFRRAGCFGLHALDELLDADFQSAINLAGFLDDKLTVNVGIEFFLTNLEGTVLAIAEC